jgi:hypothetical protein
MISIDQLSKKVAQTITIFPYKEKWEANKESGEMELVNPLPSYIDDKGKDVVLDEGWRDVGFKVPYPNVRIMSVMGQKATQLSYRTDASVTFDAHPDELAKHIVYNLIKDTIGIDFNFQEKESKKWLYEQFLLSPWLIAWWKRAYEEYAEKITKEEREEEEVFLGKSKKSSKSKSMDTEDILMEASSNE